tara:strand:- start:54 stop:404 length:351 start_codon:yes stop_codon:yes gene_type:complete
MADENNRPDHIEDVLINLHPGQWFGWSSSTRTYADIVLHPTVNGVAVSYGIPSEASLTEGLTNAQSSFDAAAYSRNRAAAYPSIGDQLDMQYHDGVNSTTTWAAAIAAVKTTHPKP